MLKCDSAVITDSFGVCVTPDTTVAMQKKMNEQIWNTWSLSLVSVA